MFQAKIKNKNHYLTGKVTYLQYPYQYPYQNLKVRTPQDNLIQSYAQIISPTPNFGS